MEDALLGARRRAPKAWRLKAACDEGDRNKVALMPVPVCAETAADALRAYVQKKLGMSLFYAVLSVRPHTVCNRNLDIRTGQGDLGS